MKNICFSIIIFLLLVGCKSGVFVINSCVWGVDADVNKITQIPHGKVGFVSFQNVYAPTNKIETNNKHQIILNGAKDVASVLVETEVPSLFDTFTGRKPLRTRVVIGEAANNVTGIVFMLRNEKGQVDENTLKALQILSKMQHYKETKQLNYKFELIKMGKNKDKRKQILDKLDLYHYKMTWDEFCDNTTISIEILRKIFLELKNE